LHYSGDFSNVKAVCLTNKGTNTQNTANGTTDWEKTEVAENKTSKFNFLNSITILLERAENSGTKNIINIMQYQSGTLLDR